MATSFRGVPNAIHRSRTHAQGSSDSISKSGWREIFWQGEVWKTQEYFVYPQGACRIRKAAKPPTAAQYFKIFKPISWGERPAERRSRFIQRFLRSFSPAACTSEKIPLSPPVCELSALGGRFVRAADCKPFAGKARRGFPAVEPVQWIAARAFCAPWGLLP